MFGACACLCVFGVWALGDLDNVDGKDTKRVEYFRSNSAVRELHNLCGAGLRPTPVAEKLFDLLSVWIS